MRKSTQSAANPATNPATNPAADPTADLARARNLEQAVRTLADQGRLPPRGSLIDLRA